jgi:hypothetical protein
MIYKSNHPSPPPATTSTVDVTTVDTVSLSSTPPLTPQHDPSARKMSSDFSSLPLQEEEAKEEGGEEELPHLKAVVSEHFILV